MTGAKEITASVEQPSRARMLVVVATGIYSWAMTVLPQWAASGSMSISGGFAGVALLALLIAPLLPPGRIALTAALDVFVGACVLAWLFAKNSPTVPPFAIFGSFGWLAYTLALGSLSTPNELSSPREVGPRARRGPRLEPRTRPSRLSATALVLSVVACLFLMGAAWQVQRPAVSVLAHVFALTTVLILLRSSAHLSAYLQVRGTKLASPPQASAALGALLLLSLMVCAAALFVWITG